MGGEAFGNWLFYGLYFWVLFSGITAIVAAVKGRSPCCWFVLGILIGPAALVVAWYVDRDDDKRNSLLQDADLPTLDRAIRSERASFYE